MDENHQDKIESKTPVTEDKLWLPPSFPKNQEEHACPQKDTLFHAIYKWTGFANKTLWDWLALLLVPIMLTVFTLSIGALQQAQLAQLQRYSSLEITIEQAREATLETYIDRISDLLVMNKLRESEPGSDIRKVAQVRTLITLSKLGGDGYRHGVLLRFLYETNLINTKNVIISLKGADLRYAGLGGFTLSGSDLSGSDLTGANLSGVNLRDADLSKADITQQQLDQVYSCKNATLPLGLTCHRNQ